MLAIMAVSILLLSCGQSNVPNDKIDSYAVVKNDSTGKMDTTVVLKPTWQQANYYAAKRGDHTIWNIIAFVLLLAAGTLIYMEVKQPKWAPFNLNATAFYFGVFILLAGALSSYKWQSSSIMWNNDKTIPKWQYDELMKNAGTTQYIWDSLENNCQIVFGPYGCYEKK